MKVLFCGDIVGRSGREAVVANIPALRKRYDLDFVFANGENAAGGFGITAALARELYDCGVDCITTGNHVWDQREIIAQIGGDPKLLRPVNFPRGTPGRGIGTYNTRGGRPVVVINVMTRLFMDPLDDPFAAVEAALQQYRLGPGGQAAILIDVHGEATSEKQALGHVADGRASLVVGSHSHVPTADARIMPGGTGYQTDAGMCGDYDSVIGMKKEPATQRFVRKMPGERLTPAEGAGTLCAVYAELDDTTGLARKVAPVRIGGALLPSLPE
ncbi:MAG TPA: TIGR00282 family metallophosphoesterase [Alphaproteobacteria bacterium]|nr:TIGR00282 family metallophosphoesterase [Alphaproteobacteria bacterium]